MKRLLFVQATAGAVLASSFAFSQGAAVAAPVPAVDSVPGDTTASQVAVAPRALGPMDAVKAVKGLYDAYKTCVDNQAVGQPCGASDSDNIRKALEELGKLNTKVDNLQNTLDERFKELDLKLSKQDLNVYRRGFVQIDENVPHAIEAFSALVDCKSAKLSGKSECTRYSLGTTQRVPVDEGIEVNRRTFLNYTNRDNLPQSVTSVIATYAGSTRSDALSDISFANVMWRFAKLKVEYEAGVDNEAFKKSNFAPIVTPSMSSEVNTYLQYYGELLATYGEVMYLRAVVQRDQAVEDGDDKAAKEFQADANLLRDQITSRIESTDAKSVAGVDAIYRLTPLQAGDIIMAADDGIGAMVFETGGRYVAGARAMRDMDVAALGRGLDLYGKYSRLKKTEPQAFPQKSDWYVVRAKTYPLLCDSSAIRGEIGRFNANWLASVLAPGDRQRYDMVTQSTRVKLLDSPPTWSKINSIENRPSADIAPDARFKECGDGRGKDYRINVWDRDWNKTPVAVYQATELRFPMTYDWERLNYKKTVLGVILPFTYEIGEGVAIKTVNEPNDSILIDVGANKLVQWPEGFSPTKMPASYRR